MRPLYFGPAERSLFGVYHPPHAGAGRVAAVVFCQPFAAEYMRAHRALRELAQRLAAVGFHGLRFDYFGTGDSPGSPDEGTVERWLEDVATAIEEAKAMSGCARVSLVGLRLGATLASMVASERSDIEKIVLWDPVVAGRSHLVELAGRHVALLARRPHPLDYQPSAPDAELLGAPLSGALRAAIERIDLLQLQRPPAPGVAIVVSDADPATERLCGNFREAGASVRYERWPGLKIWLELDDIERSLVPQSALGKVTAWLAQ